MTFSVIFSDGSFCLQPASIELRRVLFPGKSTMDLIWMLTSLNGRLNRKPYWIVGLCLLVLLLIVVIAITIVSIQSTQPELALGLATLVQLAILWPAAALMAKRFHDRNKSAAYVLLQIVPVLIQMATDLFGITGKPMPLALVDADASLASAWVSVMEWRFWNQPIDLILGSWIFIVTAWFLIELGFLRGTHGTNRYGPDPLGTPSSR
jgi:uncharacterized membrane protein YhaH (DUF805 family)